MKIVTVLGARPQFIKAAPVSRVLRVAHTEVIVHTGQHYDPQMSEVFFRELAIPTPDHTLHVGSAPHGAQTGRMLEGIEAVLHAERPDGVLVYGDTNSTLAGALAAAKLGIPIVHVEAGLRSGVRAMPEETNRILSDRLSAICCCPNDGAARNLAAEGITDGVEVVGDVMLDALLEACERVGEVGEVGEVGADSALPTAFGEPAGGYVLATIHRAANTDSKTRLRSIVDGLGSLGMPVLWPMHPRTRPLLAAAGIITPPHLHIIPALGYLSMVRALQHAACVVTDSGGLQKEAYWLGIPCVTARHETEWTETVSGGWNTLVDANAAAMMDAVAVAVCDGRATHAATTARDAYGTPGASARVVGAIERLRM